MPPKIKFIHTADLHLDTCFSGLFNLLPQIAEKLKEATFSSFQKIISGCIKHQVDFLLISGDIFNSNTRSIATQIKFINELARLSDHHIPVYIIFGNHDPADSWFDNLSWPKKVFLFGSKEVEVKTFSKSGKPLADIYGISYPSVDIKENLSLKYHLKKGSSFFSIALLHGAPGGSGPDEYYSPFKVRDIQKKGFDYWALGHLHKREIIRKENPAIVFPGNPQGRDFSEQGLKGCYLVEMSEDQAPKFQFIATQEICFESLSIKVKNVANLTRLWELIKNSINNLPHLKDNSFLLKITLTGRTLLHSMLKNSLEINELIDLFNREQAAANRFIRIDSIKTETSPDLDLKKIIQREGFYAEILKYVDDLKLNKKLSDEFIAEIKDEFIKTKTMAALNETLPENTRNLLEQAKWLLLENISR